MKTRYKYLRKVFTYNELYSSIDKLKNISNLEATYINFISGNSNLDYISSIASVFVLPFIVALCNNELIYCTNRMADTNADGINNIDTICSLEIYLDNIIDNYSSLVIDAANFSYNNKIKHNKNKKVNNKINSFYFKNKIFELISDSIGINKELLISYIDGDIDFLIPAKNLEIGKTNINLDKPIFLNNNLSTFELWNKANEDFNGGYFNCDLPEIDKNINYSDYYFDTDFETSVINRDIVEDDEKREFGYVWLFEISNYQLGINIQGKGILNWLHAIKFLTSYYGIYTVYFFNLQYDASFFMYFLVSNPLYNNSLNILQSKKNGAFFSISFLSSNHSIKILDLRRLLPQNMSLAKIAKDLVYPTMQQYPELFNSQLHKYGGAKRAMDEGYADRPLSWLATFDELEYMHSDCAVMECLIISYKKLLGFNKLYLTLSKHAKLIHESITNLALLTSLVKRNKISIKYANEYYNNYLIDIGLPNGAFDFGFTSIELFLDYINNSEELSNKYMPNGESFKSMLDSIISNTELNNELDNYIVTSDNMFFLMKKFFRNRKKLNAKLFSKTISEEYNFDLNKVESFVVNNINTIYYNNFNERKSKPTKYGIYKFITLFNENFKSTSMVFQLQECLKGEMFYNVYTERNLDAITFARKAYYGGKSETNPKYAGLVINEPVVSLDDNSFYPYGEVAYNLPFGSAKRMQFDSLKAYQYNSNYSDVLKVFIINKKSITLDSSPILTRDIHKDRTDWKMRHTVNTFNNGDMLHIHGIEYDFLIKNGIKMRISEGFRYNTSRIHSIAAGIIYIKRNIAKDAKLYALQLLEKIVLNGYTGKFGQKNFFTDCTAVIDNKNIVRYRHEFADKHLQMALENEEFSDEAFEDFDGNYNISPAVIGCITANSRVILTNIHLTAGYDNIINGDTDSVKIKQNKLYRLDNIDIDQVRLGSWKVEHTYKQMAAFGIKRYIYDLGDNCNLKAAGLPVDKLKDIRKEYNKVIDWAINGCNDFVAMPSTKNHTIVGGKSISDGEFKWTFSVEDKFKYNEINNDEMIGGLIYE